MCSLQIHPALKTTGVALSLDVIYFVPLYIRSMSVDQFQYGGQSRSVWMGGTTTATYQVVWYELSVQAQKRTSVQMSDSGLRTQSNCNLKQMSTEIAEVQQQYEIKQLQNLDHVSTISVYPQPSDPET